MKAVLLDIPPFIQCWMDERARLDQDRSDEMWDGVLHMVPPAGAGHQDRGSRLTEMLGPLARASGLRLSYETGVFRPGRTDDYRVPDIVVRADLYSSARGVEGRAELVIEIRSPNDESRDKVPFFAEMGIPEVLILEPSEPILVRLDRGGSYARVAPEADGWITSEVLPFAVRKDKADRIEVRTARETVAI